MERNEAIEVLKDFWSVYAVGTEIREAFETLIPELKESEEEIIRNRIIGYLKQDIEEHPERKERIEEMLAWLEKQGSQNLANSAKTCKVEQKPAWSEEDEKMHTATIFALAGFMGNEDKLNWLKSLKDRFNVNNEKEK